MYKLVFFVTEEALDKVKRAVFLAGAGQQGEYSECCWQVKGVGQFLPSLNANPTVGVRGEAKQIDEYRVEVRVPIDVKDACIAALKLAHPYEEPVYEITMLEAWS